MEKDAVSYTGVKGIMMLTKDTAKEVGVEDRKDQGIAFWRNKIPSSIYDRIDYELDENEKKWFAIAAYNIGLRSCRGRDEASYKDNGDPNKQMVRY